MEPIPKISHAEWQVMKVVWRMPGRSAQDLIEALTPTVDWEPATVKTLLNRLLQKKAVRFERAGKLYLYFPLLSEESFKAAEADSFVERFFDGNLSPMLAHFVNSRRLSRSELDELKKIIQDGGKRK